MYGSACAREPFVEIVLKVHKVLRLPRNPFSKEGSACDNPRSTKCWACSFKAYNYTCAATKSAFLEG